MKILSLNLYVDPACVGVNLVSAINRLSPHSARHIAGMNGNFMMQFPDVVASPDTYEEIRAMIDDADILHFNQTDWTHETFRPFIGCIRRGHKVVYHGHGGAWLLNPVPQMDRCRELGAGMVVCSPMDEAVVTGATWIPNVMLIDKLIPDWERDFNGYIIIGQAANHSAGAYKGQPMVQYMVEHLGFRTHRFPIKYEFIGDTPLYESFEIRRKHHMTVDNWVQGFSGMQGFEGLALGHVVFARFDPLVVENWAAFAPEMIPIKNVKGFDMCAKLIREYCNDRDMLQEHCMVGRRWIERWYSEEKILQKWIDYYEAMEDVKCAIR